MLLIMLNLFYFIKKIVKMKFITIRANYYFKRLKYDGFLGSAYDADSDGEEGKYYVYTYDELKGLKDIEKYFEIKPEVIGKTKLY